MLYDDSTGLAAGPSTLPAVGQLFEVGGEQVALYVDGSNLVLQIGPDKFNLDDPRTQVSSRIRVETSTVVWRIVDGEGLQRHLEYEGWWKGSSLSPMEIATRPEEHEHWDDLAWVRKLLENEHARDARKRVLLGWRPSALI